MIHNIDINEYTDVEIQFDEDTRNSIIQQFIKKYSEKYTPEEINEISNALEKLNTNSNDYNLSVFINDIDLDEDTIDEAYGDIHKVGTYNNGYEDGIDHIRKYKKEMKITNGLLLQKLDHLAYGYGNQEPLTKDEIKKIKELLEYEYTDGML
ncbi:MAG: hypothetical protein IKO49_01080 [Bacilli bacterium]|nr:hypothetical protein [Clostridia bacterium]MBR4617891.1 hypothetical protein [Bacilli bacterium]